MRSTECHSSLSLCVCCAFCFAAKEEDKKDASTASNVSSSVLNLTGIGSLGRDKRQHNGVSCYTLRSRINDKKKLRRSA